MIYHYAVNDAVARANVATRLVQAEADRRAARVAGRRMHRRRWWAPWAWSLPTGSATTGRGPDGSRPTPAGSASEIDQQLRPDAALAELLYQRLPERDTRINDSRLSTRLGVCHHAGVMRGDERASSGADSIGMV